MPLPARPANHGFRKMRRIAGIAFDKVAWAIDSIFDVRRGADTSAVIQKRDLNIGPRSLHAGHYEPTPSNAFKRVLLHLPIDPADFVFLDYGSGMGRTLLLASEYSFAEVIGVELSERLHRIAQRNLATCSSRSQRCFNRRSVWADAAEYNPPDVNLVVYAFNPFDHTVLARVLKKIEAVAARRAVYFIYLEAKHARLLDASRAFPYKLSIPLPRVLCRRPGSISSLLLYSNRPLPAH